jgi:hypothetical protein
MSKVEQTDLFNDKRICCVCGAVESPSNALWYRDLDTNKVYCIPCWDEQKNPTEREP